uniref:Uncharacterized protein n=1 Tax=Siphoviridae sp. ctg6Y13 TaxID=2826419 RepID=A0A8S5QXS9_9CAUD|nr:MAG TPA: hypothetical protein [Siphoviridae sp. ctg6Y13]
MNCGHSLQSLRELSNSEMLFMFLMIGGVAENE